MSTPFDPSAPQPPPESATGERHRPWGWIAACVLLLVVAGGLAIWAFGLQSDLDDQKAITTQAQQQAEQASNAVDELGTQVDDISQGLDDAGDQIAQAGDDAQENAQDAFDDIKGRLAALKDQIAQAAEDAGSEASPTP